MMNLPKDNTAIPTTSGSGSNHHKQNHVPHCHRGSSPSSTAAVSKSGCIGNGTTTSSTFTNTTNDATTMTMIVIMKFPIAPTRTTLSVLIIVCTLFTLLRSMLCLPIQPSPYHDETLPLSRSTMSSSSPVLLPPLLQQSPPPLRTCTSPEKDVPWVFGTTTTSSSCTNPNNTMIQSLTSNHRCGYCMDGRMPHDSDDHPTKQQNQAKEVKFAQYLYDLSVQLRALKEKECSSLIVYGVAFGEQYTHW
jgi:hypothetical protein